MGLKIQIKCKGAGEIALNQLTPLQGAFKVLTEDNLKRLCKEIMEDGFIEPISVWEDPESGKTFILNGHQRHAALLHLKEHGYKIDGKKQPVAIPQIPINIVDASSLMDAKRKILALASQYGSVSTQGLKSILDELGIPPEDLSQTFNFPEVDIASIMSGIEMPMIIGSFDEQNPVINPVSSLIGQTPDQVKEAPLPVLENLEKKEIEQITFTVTKEQANTIRAAMDLANELGEYVGTQNENKNGNAIARVSEYFVNSQVANNTPN